LTETHLVTGATGLVGSALVLELLLRTDVRVICIVRPADDPQVAQQRMEEVLNRVAVSFGLPEAMGLIQQRCRAVPGDLCREGCGVTPERVGPVTEVWHSAASLRFEEGFRDEILAQNVGGTQRMLELARRLGARKFNYVSTAYVAGSRRGLILEQLARRDTPINNIYESSKVQGEHLVAASGLDYRILRPSIVIGHSKTKAVLNASGFYAYVRKIVMLRDMLKRMGALGFEAQLEVEGDPDVHLNLIPIDAVVGAAVGISRSSSKARVFHLTNATPPKVGDLFEKSLPILGMSGPRVTRVIQSQSSHTEKLNRNMRFFTSYIMAPKRFDQTNTIAAVGPDAMRWPIDEENIGPYLRWFLDSIEAEESQRAGA
jgi:nucleoside-diphosphate-sugar epimerase